MEQHYILSERNSAADRGWKHRATAYAALDLGTNNCRLLIGVPQRTGFRVIDSYSRIVRLGDGLSATGSLSNDAMERTMQALHACATRLGRYSVQEVRGVATEACRQASNGLEFITRIRNETGLPFDIISPREEAELAVESCAPLLMKGKGQRALLFDIGGGSSELAWVRLGAGGQVHVIAYESLPIGVATLAERFFADGDAAFDRLEEEIYQSFLRFEAIHQIGQEIARGGVRLIGASSTITTLASVALNLPRYRRSLVDGRTLSLRQVDAALASIRAMGQAALARHPCIGPERAAFVLPGCVIFAAIRRLWPVPQVIVADRGLREGILQRLIRQNQKRSVRSSR